jgi:hypothetical protein
MCSYKEEFLPPSSLCSFLLSPCLDELRVSHHCVSDAGKVYANPKCGEHTWDEKILDAFKNNWVCNEVTIQRFLILNLEIHSFSTMLINKNN